MSTSLPPFNIINQMNFVMMIKLAFGFVFMTHSAQSVSVLQADGTWTHQRTVCRSGRPCDAGGQCCLIYHHGICYYGDAHMPDTCVEDVTGRCVTSADCEGGEICLGCWSNKWGRCGPHPCEANNKLCNHGDCLRDGDDYKCQCDEGFTGHDCSIPVSHPCAQKNHPCGDYGKCLVDGDSYTCECTTPDWTGPWCSVKGPCVDNPCTNGGTCVPGDQGAFTCACVDDWQGPTCAAPHPCTQTPGPCMNGGTCYKEGSDYTCLCESNFYGKNCTESCNLDYRRKTARDFPFTYQFPPEGIESYPPNLVCRIVIRARNNAVPKFRLEFERFDLEPHPTCSFDKLVIRDGHNEIADSPFCGSELPPVFTTSDGTLIMRLTTDWKGAGRGFKFTVYWVNRSG